MADTPSSRDSAVEVYRLGRTELQRLAKHPQPQGVQFYIEELQEALLDLKQATIANDEALTRRFIIEVLRLLIDLSNETSGD